MPVNWSCCYTLFGGWGVEEVLQRYGLCMCTCRRWRGARVVEEARLESLYTPKAYRGFESPSLRRSEVFI